MSSIGNITPKIAIIAIVGVVIILVIVLTMSRPGECTEVQVIQQSVKVGCSNSANQGPPPKPTNTPITAPPSTAVPIQPSFSLVGTWNFVGQARNANSPLSYIVSGAMQFLPDGSFRQITSQIGSISVNSYSQGTYRLDGNTLTLAGSNGITETQQIYINNENSFNSYEYPLWFYTATRVGT